MKLELNKKPDRRHRRLRLLLLFIFLVVCGYGVHRIWNALEHRTVEHKETLTLETVETHPPEQLRYDYSKIMAILPLSGLLKDEGYAAKRSMEFAFQDNEMDISVVYVDWELDGFDLTSDLGKSFGVYFVHMPFHMIKKLAELYPDAIIIAPTCSHEGIKSLPNVISLTGSDSREGGYVAQIIKRNDLLAKWRLGVIVEPKGYGEILFSAFQKEINTKKNYAILKWNGLSGNGIENINKFLQKKPGIIWLAGSPEWIEVVYSKLKHLGYSGLFLVPSYFDYHMVPHIPPQDLKNFLFVRPCVNNLKNDLWKSFSSRFEKAFFQAPAWIDTLFYDATVLYVQFVKHEKSNGLTSSSISRVFWAYLEQIENFNGVSGKIIFSNGGNVERPFYIAKFENGVFISAMSPTCEDLFDAAYKNEKNYLTPSDSNR